MVFLFLSCSTFGVVDSDETCCVVMVYNTADSWGVLIGDTVVIPEPQVKRHSVTHKDKVCKQDFSLYFKGLYLRLHYHSTFWGH